MNASRASNDDGVKNKPLAKKKWNFQQITTREGPLSFKLKRNSMFFPAENGG